MVSLKRSCRGTSPRGVTADGGLRPFRRRQEESFHLPSRRVVLGFVVSARISRVSKLSSIAVALTGYFISSQLKVVDRSDNLTVIVHRERDEAEEQRDDHE